MQASEPLPPTKTVLSRLAVLAALASALLGAAPAGPAPAAGPLPAAAESMSAAESVESMSAAEPVESMPAVESVESMPAVEPMSAAEPMPVAGSARTGSAAAAKIALHASFSPERLGDGTTIRVGFQIASRQAPRPVTAMQLYLPAGLGVANTDLGLETCTLARLEASGLAGCPIDSLMGRGDAITKVPFGSTFVTEKVGITLFSGPLISGDQQLLFEASGSYPVIADVPFAAMVRPDGPRYGALIDTTLPLVPGVPKGPDVALVALRTTIGPAGIVYRERVAGRTISFRPRGILLPRRCPPGGFPFAVRLTFADGSSIGAGAAVQCPRRARR